jgi:hypothetical protein
MSGLDFIYLRKTLEMLIARECGDHDSETDICGELDRIWNQLDGKQKVEVNNTVANIALLQNLDDTFKDIREAVSSSLKGLFPDIDTHVERVFITYGDDGDLYYRASLTDADTLTVNQLRELTTTIKEKLGFWVHLE